MTAKESIRSSWHRTLAENISAPQWGKAAEKLRGMREYHDAATVFATPGESLHQARINCLIDGKNLVMPGPSIREGFFLLPARSVSFKNFSAATTYRGLEKHGQLLKSDAMEKLSLGLLLTGSLAVDQEGGRIGDGKGFFDLCCALLQEFGALGRNWTALTFIREEQISLDLLPQDRWDIKMSGAVTPQRIHVFNPPCRKPAIFWDELSRDRLKRIDPLWKIYSAKTV
jgi:5-formyltetrahydrofolate cyclo-ligase